jgi:aminoglycoside phosphotransferase (APT) family kinase protein
MPTDGPGSKQAGTENSVNLDRLARWMDTVGQGSHPISCVQHLGGGTQNILMRFRRGDEEYVLRRPPRHLRANSNETMRREAKMLAALAHTNVPHPPLIAACDDLTVLGSSFYLMAPVVGFNAKEGLPASHAASATIRRRMGFALVEGIAALGALDHESLGLASFGRPAGFLERQVSRWRSQLESYRDLPGWPGSDAIPGLNEVSEWLEAHRPASFRPGIIHGDYHVANVLYRNDGPELAAIVDWELTTIADPLIDLGWLLATCWKEDPNGSGEPIAEWDAFPSAEELIAYYAARSVRDLSNIGWYAVLACFKLGILLEGTYARACAGQAPGEVGDSLHSKTLSLFQRAVRWID